MRGIILLLRKESEYRRAEYYRKNLKKIDLMYIPAIQVQRETGAFSDSMVGEFVLSPFLMLFTIWILKSAEKDGVARLYFLSRDGYPAYRMACRLCNEYGIEIECRYLYCSRYSLRVPMYSENKEEMLEYICRSGIDVSLRKILKRAGLKDEQIAQLKNDELGRMSFDAPLSYYQLGEIKQVLRNNTKFLELVDVNSREEWSSLCDYFIQEGLTEDEHIGLVDSGWIGSTQKSVYDILKRMGITTNLDGYYCGLYDIPNDMDPDRYHSFCFDKKHGMKNKLFFSNCLIETVFSETCGTTICYAKQKGKTIPILQNKRFNIDFLTKFNSLLDRYGDCFVNTCSMDVFKKLDTGETFRALTDSLLVFMYKPTIGEAELFGTLQFSDDLLDDNEKELGPIFSAEELKANHFFYKVLNTVGYNNRYIHESAWFSATVRRSTNKTVWHNYSYLAYRLLVFFYKKIMKGGVLTWISR